MTTGQQCSAKVWSKGRWPKQSQCRNNATGVPHDGPPLCTVHIPANIEARRDARSRAYIAQAQRDSDRYHRAATQPALLRELKHLVALLEPLERDGSLAVPGLATLNGAREAIAKAEGR